MLEASTRASRDTSSPRVCGWCHEPIPPWMRSDAKTCSKPCRQKLHRFRIGPAGIAASKPMKFGYADPPYPGLSKRYYGDESTFGGEVDHVALVRRLYDDYPDGWALSTSEDALIDVVRIVDQSRVSEPPARVCIWIKGSRRGKSYRARNAYEPLIVYGGRPVELEPNDVLDDVLMWGGRQHSHPDALIGMKPAAFAEWMFRQLGAQRGDTLDDLFPGSGAIGRAWEMYQRDENTSELPSRFAGAARRLNEVLDAEEE